MPLFVNTNISSINAQRQLVSSGAELDQALTELRNTTFGERGRTIAREESMGFFRYQRPRVYGRN